MRQPNFILKFAVVLVLAAIFTLASMGLPTSADAIITFARPGGATSGTCDSWANACDLTYALTAAISGTEIWVARGVYTPGLTITSTFQLTNGVALYGGFAMTETLRDQRNWQANITVLSGDIDHNDLTDANGIVTNTVNIHGVNAHHVTDASHTDSTAVLDGFTVTAGNDVCDPYPGNEYPGWPPGCRGGGMYNVQGAPMLTNVTFNGNLAPAQYFMFDATREGLGGGMYNRNSDPTLTNVTFSNNSGGGMFNDTSSPRLTDVTFRGNVAWHGGGMDNIDSSPTLTRVIFDSNAAIDSSYVSGGGGMNNYNSRPTLTNVIFRGNRAPWGGGLYNGAGSNSTLTNVVFSGNLASFNGGGLYIQSSSPTLTNVTVSGNLLSSDFATVGAGMYIGNSRPTLVNCILWGNDPDQIYADNSSVPNITYSDINSPTGIYTGVGNLNAHPRFSMPVSALLAPTTAGDYHLLNTSPAIDAGNNLSVTVDTDLDGQPRRIDIPIVSDTGNGSAPIVDMGAYEEQLYRALFLPITFK